MDIPKVIYVTAQDDDDGNGVYFLADPDIEFFEDEQVVGVYTLTKMVTKKIKHTLE